MRHLTLCLLSASLVALAACDRAAPPTSIDIPHDQRNVVLVCLDTVRYDTFTALDDAGETDALTPWLAQALRFERTQAPSPWTVPAVGSVLTGLYPTIHGAGRFAESVANLDTTVPAAMAPELPTVATRLGEAGWRTTAIAAHPWFASGFGLERGFAELHLRPDREALLARTDQWLDDRAADGDTTPFFLYLHFMEAHQEHMQDEAGVTASVGALPPTWRQAALATAPAGICATESALICQRYLAYAKAVGDLRASVAALLTRLDERDLLARTLVIVYSDHGEEFHDHKGAQLERAADPRAIYGFGHGHSLYQELLHVPLVAWHPAHSGASIGARTSLVDIAPTITNWLELDPLTTAETADWAGRDLLASADGGESEPRAFYASSLAYGPPQVSVLRGDLKRVLYLGEPNLELYDLATDPGEISPLANVPDAGRLDALIARYGRSAPPSGHHSPDLDAEEIERLQALGYLGGVDR